MSAGKLCWLKHLSSPELTPPPQLRLQWRTSTSVTLTRPRSAPCGATPPLGYATATSWPFATVTTSNIQTFDLNAGDERLIWPCRLQGNHTVDTRGVEPNMRECTFNVLTPGRLYDITVTTRSGKLNSSVSVEGRTGESDYRLQIIFYRLQIRLHVKYYRL